MAIRLNANKRQQLYHLANRFLAKIHPEESESVVACSRYFREAAMALHSVCYAAHRRKYTEQNIKVLRSFDLLFNTPITRILFRTVTGAEFKMKYDCPHLLKVDLSQDYPEMKNINHPEHRTELLPTLHDHIMSYYQSSRSSMIPILNDDESEVWKKYKEIEKQFDELSRSYSETKKKNRDVLITLIDKSRTLEEVGCVWPVALTMREKFSKLNGDMSVLSKESIDTIKSMKISDAALEDIIQA